MDKFNWNLFIFNIIKFLLSAVVNKNNRGCGCEFNNRMAVAVVEKCAVVTRLRLFAPSLIHTTTILHDCPKQQTYSVKKPLSEVRASWL